MNIRLATINDIEKIMHIISYTIEKMQMQNNFQWDNQYPAKNDFLKDIHNKELFVAVEEDIIYGVVCISAYQDEEYKVIPWNEDANQSLTIHRMAVSPEARRKGIGSLFLKFAKKYALAHQYKALRADTSEYNEAAQQLFLKHNFVYRGIVDFGKPFMFSAYEYVL